MVLVETAALAAAVLLVTKQAMVFQLQEVAQLVKVITVVEEKVTTHQEISHMLAAAAAVLAVVEVTLLTALVVMVELG
jgi:hypothetical protein